MCIVQCVNSEKLPQNVHQIFGHFWCEKIQIKLILGHFESQNSPFFGQFGAKIQIFLKDSTL